ncbi:MAG: glycosyltransferase family 4 protein [Chitinophagales bacterium]
MKIALIHYRLILRGGLERRLINYSQWLQEQGHEVHIIVAKSSGEVTLPEGVQLHILSPGLMPKVFRQRYFDHLLGRFMRHNHFDKSLSLMRTSHQDAVLCPGNHLGFLKANGRRARTLSDREQIRADQLAFQRSKVVLAASKMMANEAIGWYHTPAEKVHILHPPVNDHLFHPELKQQQAALRERYGLPADKRLFLFVSSSHKRKGLPLLLRCFAQATDTDSVLVIAGLPKVLSDLPNVIDLQFIPQMEELYAAVDFTIHPATYEPFGQIVSESLCCGTPVIVSDMVGAAEIIGNKEGLVIPLADEKLWLDTIRTIRPEAFHIAPGVAERKGLLVSQHMERMLDVI